MQFVPFHNEYKILIWVKECSESTLGREHYIEIGQIRDMETSVSNGPFLLNFLKLGQVVLTEYGKPGKPVWNNYSEKTESPDNPFTIFPQCNIGYNFLV